MGQSLGGLRIGILVALLAVGSSTVAAHDRELDDPASGSVFQNDHDHPTEESAAPSHEHQGAGPAVPTALPPLPHWAHFVLPGVAGAYLIVGLVRQAGQRTSRQSR